MRMRGYAITLMATAAIAAVNVAAGVAGELALGARAPMAKTEMRNVDGTSVTIESAAGKKGTLVIFTCNSCPWVKAWQERMVEIGNTYANRGVGVVMINSNDPGINAEDAADVMVKRAKSLEMKFPYAVDATSEIARAFGATRTPEAYLFDAQGRLVYHGTIDDNAHRPEEVSKRYLADALDAVLAGHKVSVAETKALGCSIKFRGRSENTKRSS